MSVTGVVYIHGIKGI